MKKLLLLLTLIPCLAFAAGPIDGIYMCNISGGSQSQAFITLNGQPDGRTIFAVSALTSVQPFFGYGIGQYSRGVFYGNTGFGIPFSFSADGASISGPITILTASGSYGAYLLCQRIW